MKLFVKTALTVTLFTVGGLFLYKGIYEYWYAGAAQQAAKTEWIQEENNAPLNIRAPQLKTRLEIPRLHADLFVGEGGDAMTLREGPGHLRGSALPGADGNCVIAGHRDTHFRVLKDIRKGDEIYVTTGDGRFLYRVINTLVVDPSQTRVLQPTPSPQLTLVTCYPFYYLGSAPKRFIVSAIAEL